MEVLTQEHKASFESFHDWSDHCEIVIQNEDIHLSRLISLVQVNVRSLKKHWDELIVYLSDQMSNLDIIILTEINIRDILVTSFHLKGFQSLVLCRSERRGGGIMIFVKDKWRVDKIESSFQHAEVMTLCIYNQEYTFTVGAVYRPPNANVNQFLLELKTFLNKFNNNNYFILAGDFNIDVRTAARSATAEYLNLLSGFGLENLIKDYTREEYLGNKLTKTCIDHIIVRINNLKKIAGVITQKVADHYFVAMTMLRGNDQLNLDQITEYKLILDNKKVDKAIRNRNWDHTAALDHLQAYESFVAQLNCIYEDSTIKVKIRKRKPQNCWIDKEILELCSEKDKAWKQSKKYPDDNSLKEEYRRIRNKVTAKIRLAKKRYYMNKFAESRGNLQKTWASVNELIGKPSKKKIDDTIKKTFGACDLAVLANEFNNSFATITKTLSKDNPTIMSSKRPVFSSLHSAFLPTMSELDLRDIIKTMSAHKPSGNDNIRLRDITVNFEKVAKVLLTIMNGILVTGQIPKGLKVSVVRPVYKKGSKKDLKNYRPIAISSILSHIMEKFILKHMNSFCEKHSLINSCQYGFRKNMSTTLLLEAFADNIYSALENNQIALAVFLDLSRAFDTINHKLLLDKLEYIGFRGPYLTLFTDYLSERYQCVKLDQHKSKKILVTSGVPQGSILGPFLFNIYVNDIGFLPISSKLLQYADDTAIVFSANSYEKAVLTMQRDINTLTNWFQCNSLFVNESKTNLMCFRSVHKKVDVLLPLYLHSAHCMKTGVCSCPKISYVSDTKYLGLYIDEFFSWNAHLQYLTNRLRVISMYLYKLRTGADLQLRQKVYQALGEATLRYGITVYGNCSKYKKDKLTSLLYHIANNMAYGTHYQSLEKNQLLTALEMPTVQCLFNIVVLIKHYYIGEFKIAQIKPRHLRHTEHFQVPRIHTNFGKGVRNYYVPNLFNKLPASFLQFQSFKQAKREIKQWCLKIES